MFRADAPGEYVVLFLIVIAAGAVGGLAAELLRQRSTAVDSAGRLEPIRRVGGKKSVRTFVDLGWLATVIVGAVAAIAALWLFPPEQVTDAKNAAVVVGVRYDVIKVVATSLIVGSAGSVFLGALQAKALATMQAQQAQVAQNATLAYARELEKRLPDRAADAPLVAGIGATLTAINMIGDPDSMDDDTAETAATNA